MADLTARVTCYSKNVNTDPTGDGATTISFHADPADPANAFLLGNLYVSMAVAPEAAENFETDTAYALTFSPVE